MVFDEDMIPEGDDGLEAVSRGGVQGLYNTESNG